jgi:hypothetical protein
VVLHTFVAAPGERVAHRWVALDAVPATAWDCRLCGWALGAVLRQMTFGVSIGRP